MIRTETDAYDCVGNLALALGNDENPGQIDSFGVPRTAKIYTKTQRIRYLITGKKQRYGNLRISITF